jgi:hypothetical protein
VERQALRDLAMQAPGERADARARALGELLGARLRRLEHAREEDAQQLLDDAPDDLAARQRPGLRVRELPVRAVAREDRVDRAVEGVVVRSHRRRA